MANQIPATTAGTSLSADQQRLWFLQNMSANDRAFAISSVINLADDLDEARLERCITIVLAHYPALQTGIVNADGTPQAQPLSFTAAQVWKSETLASEQDIARRIEQIVAEPFNLEKGPLFRVRLLKPRDSHPRIVVVAHRIILDRQGLYLLTQDIAHLYGSGPDAQPLGVDYSAAPQPDVSEQTLAWWQQRLEGALPLEFPIDHTRPPVQSSARSAAEWSLGAQQSAAIRAFCETHGVSVEDLLLSVFTALLYRYTTMDDLIVGLVSRPQPRVVGPLESLIPLRMSIQQTMPFAELLEKVRTARAESLERFVSLATLLDHITVERDLSRAPLVQMAFAWAGSLSDPLPAWQLPLPAMPEDLNDLQWVAWEQNDSIHLRAEYDGLLFEPPTIERIAEHYRILLSSALDNPTTSVLGLTIMSDQERETVLKTWNNTWVDYPADCCVHQLVEAQVARTPDRIAVIIDDERITYRQLNERANQLAHFLQSLDLKPDDLVGLHLPRSADMLIGTLAVNKAGAGYVSLDPHFPQDRLGMIIEDAHIKVLITHSTIMEHAPQHDAHTIVIDQCRELIAAYPKENPTSAVQPHHLMYVIFTSGSTGRPKGVELEHLSVANFLISMQREPGLTEDDVLLAVTTLSFDIAVMELYLPLITGATVLIAKHEEVLDGYRLLGLIAEHRVTMLQATPVTWRLMLESGWTGTPGLTALCGGEVLPLDLAQQIKQRCKILWNMYGPTETTVWSTLEPIHEIKDYISIGHPINNTTIYILDPSGQPTPIGVPGELVIGGDGVARGYFERPDLTAEKFVPDPFSGRANARMYRTGDIARYMPDGRLQFYGRLDQQVKVRGFRIELGEIETILDKHPRIKQNVVIVREDEPGDKQIVSYLVTHDNQDIPNNELRDHVQQVLPGYMVPFVFVRMDEMPLTPNGKINRRALPKPDYSEVKTATEYIAPRNAIEARVAEIWADALKLPRVGMDDNFFELGGHSLLAIRIFTRIEKEFGKVLPLAILFQAPTPGQFAAMLSDGHASKQHQLHPALVPIQPKGSRPTIFCVGGGIINLNNLARQLGPDQPFYALQWSGLDKDRVLDMTLGEAATALIEAMQSFQPHGPYYLAGSFTAGMVAIEMARQLDERGEKIAMLAAFDCVNRDAEDTNPVYAAKKHRSVVRKFFGIVRQGPVVFWEHLTDPIYVEQLQHYFWKAAIKVLTTLHRPIPLWLRSGMYEEFFIRRAIKRHTVSQPYRGSFDVFLTPHYYEKYGIFPKFGWANWVAGEVTAHMTPGIPCTIMLSPNVEQLGNGFQSWMRQRR